MQMTITSVDYAPDELHEQVPIVVRLLRPIAAEEDAKHWLGAVQPPIRWLVDGTERAVTHVVVTAGEAFDAPGFFRISYAASINRLEEAARRIHAFVADVDAGKYTRA